MFFFKKYIFADIGSSSVKVAQFVPLGKGFKLLAFGMANQTGEQGEGGHFEVALKEALGQAGIKAKSIDISSSHKEVFVRAVTLEEGVADDADLSKEIVHYIPYAPDLVHIATHRSSIANQFLVSCISNSLVSELQTKLFSLDMKCERIVPSVLAMCNAVQFMLGDALKGTCVAILDLAHTESRFVVIYKGEVIFTKKIVVGGLTYTEKLMHTMGVSKVEAESIKISTSKNKDTPENASETINRVHQDLTAEFKEVVEMFSIKMKDLKLEKVYLTGGMASFAPLVQMLAGVVPVEILRPEQSIQCERVNNGAGLPTGGSFALLPLLGLMVELKGS